MTLIAILAGYVLWASLIMVFSLCRAASRGDRMMEEFENEVRKKL